MERQEEKEIKASGEASGGLLLRKRESRARCRERQGSRSAFIGLKREEERAR